MADVTLKHAQYLYFKAAESGIIRKKEYFILPSGMKAEVATYQDYSDYSPYYTTPFVSALQPFITDTEFVDISTHYPPAFSDYERSLSHIKKHYRARSIGRMFQPTGKHFELARSIDEALRERYSEKAHAGEVDNDQGGITVYGISGMGKTVALNIILSYYPQVIIHPKHPDIKLRNCLQVTWLKITCPHKGGELALCNDILGAADKLLGQTNQEGFKKALGNQGDLSVTTYIDRVKKLIEDINLGALIIDEIQFLTRSSSKADILKFLIKLRIELGIPVIYVGTFELQGMYDDLSMAYQRKGTSIRDEYFEPYELTEDGAIPEDFHMLINFLFENYQITLTPTDYSTELSKTIYEQTAGILFFIINLFILIQQHINKLEEQGNKDVTITTEVIKKTATTCFRRLRPYVQALVSGDKESLKTMQGIDVEKYRLRNLSKLYKPGGDGDGIERAVQDFQRKHGLRAQLLTILRQSNVPKKQADSIFKVVLDSYNNEPQHIVVMKALNMYEEMQRTPEKPEEPVRLSPGIERASVDLEKIKGQLESFDQLVSTIGGSNPR